MVSSTPAVPSQSLCGWVNASQVLAEMADLWESSCLSYRTTQYISHHVIYTTIQIGNNSIISTEHTSNTLQSIYIQTTDNYITSHTLHIQCPAHSIHEISASPYFIEAHTLKCCHTVLQFYLITI